MSLYEINNRFWEWAEMNPISANACCLFGAVVQCLNRGGWPRELAIPLSKLLAMTHLSRPALYRARAELMQAGLLQVQESGSRKASVYGLTLRSPAWLEGEEGEAADMSRKTYLEAAAGRPQEQSRDMSRDMSQEPSRDMSQDASHDASQEPSQNGGQKWELIKNKTKTKTKTKTLSPAARQRFGEFWDLYPRKSGMREAERAWADTVGEDEELYLTVMEALSKQVFWEQWQRDGGRFIPYPARWLEQRLWEDQAVCLPRMPSKYDRVRINDFSESADLAPPKKPSKYDNVKIN
ncbi:MAG: hypothetical protein IIY40_04765 [Firmicutes bacterium]|nr:hypothetical protein [Bacillota bacterium]